MLAGSYFAFFISKDGRIEPNATDAAAGTNGRLKRFGLVVIT